MSCYSTPLPLLPCFLRISQSVFSQYSDDSLSLTCLLLLSNSSAGGQYSDDSLSLTCLLLLSNSSAGGHCDPALCSPAPPTSNAAAVRISDCSARCSHWARAARAGGLAARGWCAHFPISQAVSETPRLEEVTCCWILVQLASNTIEILIVFA